MQAGAWQVEVAKDVSAVQTQATGETTLSKEARAAGGQGGDNRQAHKCGIHRRGAWRAVVENRAVSRGPSGEQRTARLQKQFSEV